MRRTSFFGVGAQNGGFWVGAKQFTFKGFMYAFCHRIIVSHSGGREVITESSVCVCTGYHAACMHNAGASCRCEWWKACNSTVVKPVSEWKARPAAVSWVGVVLLLSLLFGEHRSTQGCREASRVSVCVLHPHVLVTWRLLFAMTKDKGWCSRCCLGEGRPGQASWWAQWEWGSTIADRSIPATRKKLKNPTGMSPQKERQQIPRSAPSVRLLQGPAESRKLPIIFKSFQSHRGKGVYCRAGFESNISCFLPQWYMACLKSLLDLPFQRIVAACPLHSPTSVVQFHAAGRPFWTWAILKHCARLPWRKRQRKSSARLRHRWSAELLHSLHLSPSLHLSVWVTVWQRFEKRVGGRGLVADRASNVEKTVPQNDVPLLIRDTGKRGTKVARIYGTERTSSRQTPLPAKLLFGGSDLGSSYLS